MTTAPSLDLSIAIFALIGGFVPALVWLWFWLKEDKAKPEPVGLVARVFVVGGLSVAVAFVIQRFLAAGSTEIGWGGFDYSEPSFSWSFFLSSFGFLLAWAATEEIIKFGAAYFSAFRNRNFDEPIDAMIYCITAAIGFAAVENTLFLLSSILSDGDSFYFLLTGNLRFMGATVVHIVSSAIVGGLIAMAFCSPKITKTLAAIIGLFTATILHALFNFLIITSSATEMIWIFVGLWLVAIFILYFFERVKKIICQPMSKTVINK
jgi:RsiW-degrading membrane proteinase PrsW (M82 family)